jgi:hypothetical protein
MTPRQPQKAKPVTQATDIALIQQDIEALNARLAAMEKGVSDLVSAWRAAGTLVSFVKWAAGVVTAVAILWGVFKGHIPK